MSKQKKLIPKVKGSGPYNNNILSIQKGNISRHFGANPKEKDGLAYQKEVRK